jgi:ribonuclease G
MNKEIILNATASEIRIAITEEGKLAELFVEQPEKERMVGDIYLGKVAKVMPGIRAAFIDIGQKQDAFLHFSDVGEYLSEYSAMIGDDSEVDTDEAEGEGGGNGKQLEDNSRSFGRPVVSQANSDVRRDNLREQAAKLQKGQDIIVQITKEPVGNKGVRVTSEVSLPGRYLVLMPFDDKIGVSKKITSYREKRRLRQVVRPILPDRFGVIIRTVAEGKGEPELRSDLEQLISTWREIEKSVKGEKAPALLYKDLSITSSVMRDLFSKDVSRVVTDSRKLFREIRAYLKGVAPLLVDKIELYKGREPVFDVFHVEKEIEQTLSRKVWLKSGGYIIVEHTEAMVVIDVNSGRYAAKREQELNSLRTNLEAAREISRQIRLRDIGGIIVIDFIDLEDEKNKKKVYDEVKKEFRKDRAKATILPMTEFGLVQITRQRIRQSLLFTLSEPCPMCAGTGLVQSKSTVATQIERWIRRFKSESKEYRLSLTVHPVIADYLTEGPISRLTRLRLKFFVSIKLVPDKTFSVDEFKFFSRKQNRDITDLYKS